MGELVANVYLVGLIGVVILGFAPLVWGVLMLPFREDALAAIFLGFAPSYWYTVLGIGIVWPLFLLVLPFVGVGLLRRAARRREWRALNPPIPRG